VAVERTELTLARVGVSIKVDDRDPAESDVVCHPGHVGKGDRVIAAKDDRNHSLACDHGDAILQKSERSLGLARGHLDVAKVNHAQRHKWI